MSDYMEDYMEKKFNIELSQFNIKTKLSLTGIVEMLMDIYPQLVTQGLKKEDARAFLPSNVQCRRLYMTFTYYTFDMFLTLRTDPHAQSEIRKYANALREKYIDVYFLNK
jgi:thymidylate synthase ThyX